MMDDEKMAREEAEPSDGGCLENIRSEKPVVAMRKLLALRLAIVLISSCAVVTAAAQTDDATDLAKKTQNPVADLISVPFQNNWNFQAGAHHNKRIYVLNIQPVVPIKLTDDWNMIARVIMPIVDQHALSPAADGGFGLGDMNPTFFFAPSKPGAIIWGLGPTFTFPTATQEELGAEKWSVGPAAVILTMPGHWVFGALVNNQWSIAGWGKKNVNTFLMQPFVNYNLPDGWYLVSAPIVTADWKAKKAGDVWTLPVGAGVGKLFKLGDVLPLEGRPLEKFPINAQIGAYGNVLKPEFGPAWQLRFQVQFLFPR
ncbi:MAG TPA: neuromedin U [Candidatus Binatia bacterium]|jgi:hypothetical protein